MGNKEGNTMGTQTTRAEIPHGVFCLCNCGEPVPQTPNTYRFYATAECAARALATRLGYVRVGAVNLASITTETTTMKSKTSTKKAAVKATAPDEYSAKKLGVMNRCKIGATYTYNGRNTTIDGQRVKVVGHEERAGGVYVEFKGERFTVSPFSLLGITVDGNAKGTATPAKATVKVKAQPKPATKPAPKKPAPTPAAPPADVSKTTKAAKAA